VKKKNVSHHQALPLLSLLLVLNVTYLPPKLTTSTSHRPQYSTKQAPPTSQKHAHHQRRQPASSYQIKVQQRKEKEQQFYCLKKWAKIDLYVSFSLLPLWSRALQPQGPSLALHSGRKRGLFRPWRGEEESEMIYVASSQKNEPLPQAASQRVLLRGHIPNGFLHKEKKLSLDEAWTKTFFFFPAQPLTHAEALSACIRDLVRRVQREIYSSGENWFFRPFRSG